MSSGIDRLKYLASWRVTSCALTALVLLYGTMYATGRTPFADFLVLSPTKAFVAGLFLAAVARLFSGTLRRQFPLLSVGIAVALLGVLANYALSFRGYTTLGPGEDLIPSGYERVTTGLAGRNPTVALKIEAITADSSGRVSLSAVLDGKGSHLDRLPGALRGPLASLFAPSVRIVRTGLAPRFVIASPSGEVLDAAYAKAAADRGAADYFRSPVLPHRVYFSCGSTPEAPVSLRVARGKIVILDRKDLKRNEKISFEGFALSYSEIVPWVEVEVSSFPGNPVILAGGVIALFAGGLAALGVRKRESA